MTFPGGTVDEHSFLLPNMFPGAMLLDSKGTG